MEKLKDVIV